MNDPFNSLSTSVSTSLSANVLSSSLPLYRSPGTPHPPPLPPNPTTTDSQVINSEIILISQRKQTKGEHISGVPCRLYCYTHNIYYNPYGLAR